jgi:ketosteroid isomerase-like protein
MVFIRYAFTVTATGRHVVMNMHHYWKFRGERRATSAVPRTQHRLPRP